MRLAAVFSYDTTLEQGKVSVSVECVVSLPSEEVEETGGEDTGTTTEAGGTAGGDTGPQQPPPSTNLSLGRPGESEDTDGEETLPEDGQGRDTEEAEETPQGGEEEETKYQLTAGGDYRRKALLFYMKLIGLGNGDEEENGDSNTTPSDPASDAAAALIDFAAQFFQ